MAFALEEGKVAIHCHAGLGRTGTENDLENWMGQTS